MNWTQGGVQASILALSRGADLVQGHTQTLPQPQQQNPGMSNAQDGGCNFPLGKGVIRWQFQFQPVFRTISTVSISLQFSYCQMLPCPSHCLLLLVSYVICITIYISYITCVDFNIKERQNNVVFLITNYTSFADLKTTTTMWMNTSHIHLTDHTNCNNFGSLSIFVKILQHPYPRA